MSKTREQIVNDFFQLYLDKSLGQDAYWCGVHTEKCPLDAWIFQEIIWQNKPDLIIECGTARGGSALFMAMIFDRIGNGRIITIDESNSYHFRNEQPKHSRIKYIIGSSVDDGIVKQVQEEIKLDDKVMVILDSAHFKSHVYQELIKYHNMVSIGQMLIVEDTFWKAKDGVGPGDAVVDFMKEYSHLFEIDKKYEKFLVTYNPNGFLKRIL